MSAGAITLFVEDPGWRRTRGLNACLRRAAGAALKSAGLSGGLTLLLSSDEKLKALNRDFRGRAARQGQERDRKPEPKRGAPGRALRAANATRRTHSRHEPCPSGRA
jgi:hypothetical protein